MTTFDITDFHARPGVPEPQTPAIQAAIDACADQGGGTVLVPPGIFRTGTLRLRSHITLRLENGAVLQGPDTIGGYERVPFAWELYSHTLPLLYALGERHVRIEGQGTIDFRGIAFARTDTVCVAPGVPEPLRSDAHYEMPPRNERPNRLVFFHDCEDIDISGVTFRDSPTWTLVLSRCAFLRLHDLRIDNHLRIPNNDGIHLCGCRDAIISGCFISCGDDAIAVTSISDESAVSERILISGCVLRSRSAAIRLGFQRSKVRQVRVSDCIIHDSNRGVAVFADPGGFVEDITLEGLTLETRLHAGYWWGNGEPLVVCSGGREAPIRRLVLRETSMRSENGIVVVGDGASVRLERLDLELSYGTRRPWVPSVIDLAPHPSPPAPDPARCLPWLWTGGQVAVRCADVQVRRAPGDTHPFRLERQALPDHPA